MTTKLLSPQDLIGSQGFYLTHVDLPDCIQEFVTQRNWKSLDHAIARETIPGGVIFNELLKYTQFSQIEFIISIRSSKEYPDEDGIWHDDGSRLLAFSLSLTFDPHSVDGGRLEIRKRAVEVTSVAVIQTPRFGTLIVFATGCQGFEHKINRVVQGERIIIAGWCT